jgi:hypothetical protein
MTELTRLGRDENAYKFLVRKQEGSVCVCVCVWGGGGGILKRILLKQCGKLGNPFTSGSPNNVVTTSEFRTPTNKLNSYDHGNVLLSYVYTEK